MDDLTSALSSATQHYWVRAKADFTELAEAFPSLRGLPGVRPLDLLTLAATWSMADAAAERIYDELGAWEGGEIEQRAMALAFLFSRLGCWGSPGPSGVC